METNNHIIPNNGSWLRHEPISTIILDEIALEGLEGITLQSLWVYLSAAVNRQLPLSAEFREHCWTLIKKAQHHLQFYELPEERPAVKLYNRFENVDPDLGVPVLPEVCPFVRYKYAPVEDKGIRGSCEFYKERVCIDFMALNQMNIDAVEEIWGNKLVIVASQKVRLNSLIPINVLSASELTIVQYCVWEAIGRARFNGETTSGKWSLLHFCKDSPSVFYTKTKLTKLGFITAQTYTERIKDRYAPTTLLTLPRFRTSIRSKLFNNVEKIYLMLKEDPDHSIKLDEVRQRFSGIETNKSLRKITSSSFFRRIFTISPKVEDESEDKTVTSKERVPPLYVSLRNPNSTLEEIFEEDQDVSKKDNEEAFLFCHEKHTFVDMPLKYAAYRAILKHGPTGCSQTMLTNYLCLSKPKVEDESEDKTVTSKERVPPLYVSLRNPNSTLEEIFEEDQDVSKKDNEEAFLFCHEKHTFVDMPLKYAAYRAILKHGPTGCSQTMLTNYLCLSKVTGRHIIKSLLAKGFVRSYCIDAGRQRTNMYVAFEYNEIIEQKKDNDVAILKNLQCTSEPKTFDVIDPILPDVPAVTARIKAVNVDTLVQSRDTLTSRQIQRKVLIVRAVDERSMVAIFVLRSIIQQKEKELGYKTDPCMKSIRRLVQTLCNSNIVKLYEITLQYEHHVRLYRYVAHPKIDLEHEALKNEISKLKNALYLHVEELNHREATAEATRQRRLLLATKKTSTISAKTSEVQIPRAMLKPPKFLISRYIHEFLFYIVVELNDQQPPKTITRELLEQWLLTEPALDVDKYWAELSEDGVSHPIYTDDISWRTFITPMPKYAAKPACWVCFLDVVDRMPLSIFDKIFRLRSNADPALRAYLDHPVRQHYLMSQLPAQLRQISRVEMQKVYINVLKLLNHMGLIQVSERHVRDPFLMWIYLNRKATVLDTTPTEASYGKINPQRRYEAIEFEFGNLEDINRYWQTLQRVCVYTKLGFRVNDYSKVDILKEFNFLGSVGFDEAPYNDNGSIPGDLSGAGGLASNLFAHTFRNWSWSLHTKCKQQIKRTGRTVSVKKSRADKKIKKSRKKNTSGLVKRLAPVAKKVSKTKKSKVSGPRDAIDREALRNMTRLRTKWSKKEDSLLKMSRAVYQYIAAPITVLERITVGKICRDVIRHCFGEYNKTMMSCVRRLNFIMKTNRHLPEVPNWLHYLNTNEFIQCKYGENFLERLKAVYPNTNEYNEAVALHFTLILEKIFKVFISGDCGIEKHKFLLPNTIEDFENRYKTFYMMEEDLIEHYTPSSEFELQVSMVLAVLHSSMCSACDKTLYNAQTFEIYKTFSEEVLQAAFTKARLDGLVTSIKRKNIGRIQTELSAPSYSLAAKYRFRLIFLKMSYEIYDVYYTQFLATINNVLAMKNSNHLNKQIFEIKSPNIGQVMFLGEAITVGFININFKLPTNILTFDAERIFDAAPEMEYMKRIEGEHNQMQTCVTFYPSNLLHKVNYIPYDYISKLNTRHIHFFCALNHIDRKANLDYNELYCLNEEGKHMEIKCPFECVMKSENYINAIEQIVKNKREVLKSLTEQPKQERLDLAANNFVIKVKPTNLATIVNMLDSFWRDREFQHERMDLGKISVQLKAVENIDWNQLCKELLEFDPLTTESDGKNDADDHEPILNKEERIARANDVLVVKLPVLQIKVNDKWGKKIEHFEEEARKSSNKKQLTIEEIITDINREEILQKVLKESYWSYSSNNFESLKPQLNELNFNAVEQDCLKKLIDFIEKFSLGVTVPELLQEFPNRDFLILGLHVLIDHLLIKRVGVGKLMYVHKCHVRQWVVHTFHVKRLQRENQDTSLNRKRPHSDEDFTGESVASTSKQAKLDAANNVELIEDSSVDCEPLSKRISQPVKRYEGLETITTQASKQERNVIVIRPQPWIRLNGSLNRRVLDRWLGCVLSECIALPGCLVTHIFKRFPQMPPVEIIFLLEILCDLRCIRLTEMSVLDIVDDYDDIKEIDVTELYDPEYTFITTSTDALMRMTAFFGKKKYTTEFI